jgi:hypothetical protein
LFWASMSYVIPIAVNRDGGTCAGHGVPIPKSPPGLPADVCALCRLPFPPPFVPPPANAPAGFTPGAYVDGVCRGANGHIQGIIWDQLRGDSAHLACWKDRAIGPGHPLAQGMDPRSFIPGVPTRDKPSPVPRPHPEPRATPRAGTGQSTFPEVVGLDIAAAVAAITAACPGFNVVPTPAGSMVTMDYREDRVRVYHGPDGICCAIPRVG